MNKSTNAGRHATGGKLARPGTIRGGQSVSARPITDSRPEMKPRPPVLTDANTSRAAQGLVSRPPQPFDNPYSAKNVPAPVNQTNQRTQVAGLPAKGIYGSGHGGYNVTNVGCGATATTKEALAATGYDSKPKGNLSATAA